MPIKLFTATGSLDPAKIPFTGYVVPDPDHQPMLYTGNREADTDNSMKTRK